MERKLYFMHPINTYGTELELIPKLENRKSKSEEASGRI